MPGKTDRCQILSSCLSTAHSSPLDEPQASRDSGVSNGLSRSRAENVIVNVFPNAYCVTSAESICVRKILHNIIQLKPLVSGYQNGQIGPMLLNILMMM